MLRQNVGIQRSCITDDLDLEIAHTVTGIERTDQWKNRVQNGVATAQQWKIDLEFSSRRPETETPLLRHSRPQRITIPGPQSKPSTRPGSPRLKPLVSQ